METTERIVETYVRHVKNWATIPNVHCDGQNEIDLIAIDSCTGARYHIEVSISISQTFGRLTGQPYDAEKAKQRGQAPTQRRTIGFFAERKFNSPTVIERLKEFGFEADGYTRIVVSWGWDHAAAEQADVHGIVLWDFRDILEELAASIGGSRTYYADDILRTLNLFTHALDHRRSASATRPPVDNEPESATATDRYWVYENWTHDYATVHIGDCSFCNAGRGTHPGSSNDNGQWQGPFPSEQDAWERARRTERTRIAPCRVCLGTADNEKAASNS